MIMGLTDFLLYFYPGQEKEKEKLLVPNKKIAILSLICCSRCKPDKDRLFVYEELTLIPKASVLLGVPKPALLDALILADKAGSLPLTIFVEHRKSMESVIFDRFFERVFYSLITCDDTAPH